MPSYRTERLIHPHDTATTASSARNDRSVRGSSLPRIDVIEDEMDISVGNSPLETEDILDSSDYYESEDEVSTPLSARRLPAPHGDSPVAWPLRYGSPTPEYRSPQPDLLTQRRASITCSPSHVPASAHASRNNHWASRRSSTPHIDGRYHPPDQGPSTEPPPPKPSKPPFKLKLYPWMTAPESPPPRRTPEKMIRCSYQTNDCTEILPKHMITWRGHLADKHGLVRDSVLQTCQWPGCGMIMGGRSLNRHVLMKHMDFKPSCPHCKVRRRYDHMDKHILNCPSHPARGRG